MKDFLIAERYALGLSKAIDNDGELTGVRRALREFADVYRVNSRLQAALTNPALATQSRERVLQGVLSELGMPDVARRFLAVLLRRGRIALVGDIVTVFRKEVDRRLNQVTAHITTAAPMTPEQEQRIERLLAAFSGKTVFLDPQIDPEILGGVVARLGSTIIDGSLRTRLARLRDALISEER